MRWMVMLIMVLLAIFYFLPDPEPKPIEETFIGNQIKPLKKAEGFEDEYLKAVDERKKRMEEELEKSGG
jgi:hypothetical protein